MFQYTVFTHILVANRVRLFRSSWIIILAVVATSIPNACDSKASNIAYSQFNVVILGNLSPVESMGIAGSALVGGNAGGTGNLSISTQQSVSPSTPTLIVSGLVNSIGTLQIANGSLLAYSSADVSVLGTVDYSGGGSAIYNSSTLAGDVSTVSSQLRTATAAYSALSANNSISFNGSTATFDAVNHNANGVAVFSVGATALETSREYSLSVGTGVTSILINVTGSSFANYAAFSSGWTPYAPTTMWNFAPSITSIVTYSAWDGAIMAPGANLVNYADVNGAVFVHNLSAYADIGLPLYDGYAVLPEPSTVVLLSIPIALACGHWLTRWRRGRHQHQQRHGSS